MRSVTNLATVVPYAPAWLRPRRRSSGVQPRPAWLTLRLGATASPCDSGGRTPARTPSRRAPLPLLPRGERFPQCSSLFLREPGPSPCVASCPGKRPGEHPCGPCRARPAELARAGRGLRGTARSARPAARGVAAEPPATSSRARTRPGAPGHGRARFCSWVLVLLVVTGASCPVSSPTHSLCASLLRRARPDQRGSLPWSSPMADPLSFLLPHAVLCSFS